MNKAEFIARPDDSQTTTLIDRQGSKPTRDNTPLALEYLRIANRWKYVILATIAGFLIFGLVITLLMTPKFTATVQMEISRESNKIVNLQGVEQEASDADQEFYQTQYGIATLAFSRRARCNKTEAFRKSCIFRNVWC